jgi:hypothetical protein
MSILPVSLSFAILSSKAPLEKLSLTDIIARLTAIHSIADVPMAFVDAVAFVEELEVLEAELLRRTSAEFGDLIPASTTHH